MRFLGEGIKFKTMAFLCKEKSELQTLYIKPFVPVLRNAICKSLMLILVYIIFPPCQLIVHTFTFSIPRSLNILAKIFIFYQSSITLYLQQLHCKLTCIRILCIYSRFDIILYLAFFHALPKLRCSSEWLNFIYCFLSFSISVDFASWTWCRTDYIDHLELTLTVTNFEAMELQVKLNILFLIQEKRQHCLRIFYSVGKA